MNNYSPNKTKRMALMISGALDALLGSFFLLVGVHLLPIDLARYGLQDWHIIVFGGIFFIIGIGVFAYNFSRVEE